MVIKEMVFKQSFYPFMKASIEINNRLKIETLFEKKDYKYLIKVHY